LQPSSAARFCKCFKVVYLRPGFRGLETMFQPGCFSRQCAYRQWARCFPLSTGCVERKMSLQIGVRSSVLERLAKTQAGLFLCVAEMDHEPALHFAFCPRTEHTSAKGFSRIEEMDRGWGCHKSQNNVTDRSKDGRHR
jgi:hypothetical protein